MGEVHDERGFSGREIGAAVVFVVLAGVIAFTSYRAGTGMSGGAGGGGGRHRPGPAGHCRVDPCRFQRVGAARSGPGGRMLAPVMPRFAESGFGGEMATDEQVQAIHAYVKNLQ